MNPTDVVLKQTVVHPARLRAMMRTESNGFSLDFPTLCFSELPVVWMLNLTSHSTIPDLILSKSPNSALQPVGI